MNQPKYKIGDNVQIEVPLINLETRFETDLNITGLIVGVACCQYTTPQEGRFEYTIVITGGKQPIKIKEEDIK